MMAAQVSERVPAVPRAKVGSITSYRDLRVWQLGMDLAEGSWTLTRSFPKDELFGLTSQIRRAASSVPANIAEGYGRDSTGDYIRFLRVAQGSLKELETHLVLSQRVGITTEESLSASLQLADDLGRMLRSLYASLERRPSLNPRTRITRAK